jgi:hypothetical protein
MNIKNNPLKLREIDWTAKMSNAELLGANRAIQILNQYKSVIPKFERASLEKMSVLDEPKDPYSGLHSSDEEVHIDTDGQLTYGISFASGSITMKPFEVKNYNYVIIKHVWPDKTSSIEEKKVRYISVIVKTYAMKIYVMSRVNTIAGKN